MFNYTYEEASFFGQIIPGAYRTQDLWIPLHLTKHVLLHLLWQWERAFEKDDWQNTLF